MRRTQLLTTGLLAAWATVCTVAGAGLMRPHWVPQPVPPADRPAGTGYQAESRDWVALHALSSECACSRLVLRQLAARAAEPGVRERVLWVTEAGVPPAVVPAGFEVECMSGGELAERHGIEAAPVLVVLAPGGVVRYRGGYADRKQSLAIQDRAILAALRRGLEVASLPVYGCANRDQPKAVNALLPRLPAREAP